MSTMEFVLLVAICIVPIIAVFFVVNPKLKAKKSKNKDKKEVVTENVPSEDPTEESKTEESKKLFTPTFITTGDATDEFKGYLEEKMTHIDPPKRKNVSLDELPETLPYVRERKKKQLVEKNINEQIDDLSPEILTLILSGAFDRKYFN